jgi:hypothetical protein
MNINSKILCTIIYDSKNVNKNQVGRIVVAYLTTKSCSNVTGRINIALKRNLSKTTIMIITIMINAI